MIVEMFGQIEVVEVAETYATMGKDVPTEPQTSDTMATSYAHPPTQSVPP